MELARIAQDNAMRNVTPEMLDARRRRSEQRWEHSRNRADYRRRIAEQREAAYWAQVAAAQEAANQRAEFMSHVRSEPVLTGIHGTSFEIGGGQRAYNFVPEYEYRYYYEP